MESQDNAVSTQGAELSKTEQQKATELYEKISILNDELGQELTTSFSGKRTTFLVFNVGRPAAGDMFQFYGVDAKTGPVSVGIISSKAIATSTGTVQKNLDTASIADNIPVFPIRNESGMGEWQKSFEATKHSILQNYEKMEEIRKNRVLMLDKALEIASQPINFSEHQPTQPSNTQNN